jgi:hypothetical protein
MTVASCQETTAFDVISIAVSLVVAATSPTTSCDVQSIHEDKGDYKLRQSQDSDCDSV